MLVISLISMTHEWGKVSYSALSLVFSIINGDQPILAGSGSGLSTSRRQQIATHHLYGDARILSLLLPTKTLHVRTSKHNSNSKSQMGKNQISSRQIGHIWQWGIYIQLWGMKGVWGCMKTVVVQQDLCTVCGLRLSERWWRGSGQCCSPAGLLLKYFLPSQALRQLLKAIEAVNAESMKAGWRHWRFWSC